MGGRRRREVARGHLRALLTAHQALILARDRVARGLCPHACKIWSSSQHRLLCACSTTRRFGSRLLRPRPPRPTRVATIRARRRGMSVAHLHLALGPDRRPPSQRSPARWSSRRRLLLLQPPRLEGAPLPPLAARSARSVRCESSRRRRRKKSTTRSSYGRLHRCRRWARGRRMLTSVRSRPRRRYGPRSIQRLYGRRNRPVRRAREPRMRRRRWRRRLLRRHRHQRRHPRTGSGRTVGGGGGA